MKSLNSYFIEHDLFTEENLKNHCDRHLVRVHTSTKFPNLRLLHYMEEAVYSKSWTEFCKACRGVVVDLKSKELLAVPYFKFYNMTEAPGPSYAECQSFGPFTVSEKLDGSMIILFSDPETELACATTKGSFDSSQGEDATKWARENLPLAITTRKFLDRYTLMFEWIAYDNQIVISYARKGYKPGLYLIGVRERFSEKLFSYEEIQSFAEQHGLLTVKTYPFSSLDAVMATAKDLPFQEEGYVVRFKANGLMCKVKGSAYLAAHKFLSRLDDKHLLEFLKEGTEKQMLEQAPEEYRDEVEVTITNYRRQALVVQGQTYQYFSEAPKESRKEFAMHVLANTPKEYHKYLFTLMDHKPLELRVIYDFFYKSRQGSLPTLDIKGPSLVLMVGTSGSGKSYLAKSLFSQRCIISSDLQRELLLWNGQVPDTISTESYWAQMQACSHRAFQLVDQKVEQLLADKDVAVVDATNLRASTRKSLESLASRYGASVFYVVMQADESLCVTRDASRKFPVGASIIAKQKVAMDLAVKDLLDKSNAVFVNPRNCDQLKVNLVSSPDKKVKPLEPVEQDTIVFDMDGTLSNLDHRLHYIQSAHPNWDMFFSECDKDLPVRPVVAVAKAMLQVGYKLIVVSARSQVVYDKTRKWLDSIGLQAAELILVRPEKDHSPDQILKQKWLDSVDKRQILFTVDDRQRVVDTWRANGLTCFQCNQWEERKKPTKLLTEKTNEQAI